MSKTAVRSVLVLALLALLVGGGWWWRSRATSPAETEPPKKTNALARDRPAPPPPGAPRVSPPNVPSEPPAPAVRRGLSAAEKAARIEQIKRDYEELAAKLGAEFSAAGGKSPSGLNAYLRQLALLEREKRKDFAEVLSPVELEDLEMRETPAGKAVQQGLGDSAATDEQRRAVFRLQQQFDDKFSLSFDLSPPALLARQTERQQLQAQVLETLGPELFGAWLRTDGPDYGKMAAFVRQQGLPAENALELWRVKSALALRHLELAAKTDLSAEMRAQERTAALQWARDRIASLIGAGALQTGGRDVFGWLPEKP